MREVDARRLHWIASATAATVLAVTLWNAPTTRDVVRLYVVFTVIQVLIAVASFVALGRPTSHWDPTLHTEARWRFLRAIRVVSIFGTILCILAAAWIVLSSGADAPMLQNVAPALASVALLESLGALAEEPRHAPRPRVHRPEERALYRAGGRAVFHDGRGVFTQTPHGTVPLTEVERSVDERAWRQGRRPSSDELREALERWGRSEGDR